MIKIIIKKTFVLSTLLLYGLGTITAKERACIPQMTSELPDSDYISYTATPQDPDNWNELYYHSHRHEINIEGRYSNPKNLDGRIEYSYEYYDFWEPLTDMIPSGSNFNGNIQGYFDPELKIHSIHLRIVDSEGNVTLQKPIEYLDISNMELDPFTNPVYNGTPQYQNVTSPDTESENFNVTDYENNINAGTAWFYIEGVYPKTIGIRYCEFSILPAPLEGNIVLNQTEYDFTEYDIWPDFYLEGPVSDLTYGIDYETVFENCHYAGMATASVKGINNYGGTISTNFQINKKHFPEEWLDYRLPEEDITFDGETHQAWAEYRDGAGEPILTYRSNEMSSSDAPSTPGDYEVYLRYPEGPGYYALPERKIGNFSIYELNEDDWISLYALNEELGKENDKNAIWPYPLTDEKKSAAFLHNNGLQISKGLIKSVDLRGKELKGQLPLSAFNFNHLEYLDLGWNKFIGQIDRLALIKESASDAMNSVKILCLDNNLLTGNAGVLAIFPNLEYISIENNSISDIIPMINAETVLDYSGQNLDIEMTLDLRDFKLEEIVEKVPTIALYNHNSQSYSYEQLRLQLYDDREWDVELELENGQPQAFTSYSSNVFTGGQGETLNANLLPNNCKGKARFWFKPGDVDFNGRINVLDVQSAINYILDTRYHIWVTDPRYYDPVNFTAANLYEDEAINVQDLVRLVDLIMESNPSDQEVSKNAARYAKSAAIYEDEETATVHIDNGTIFISSDIEVAAFDIMVDASDITVKSIPGFGITKKCHNGKTRLVGYSISGATIPEGNVCIGTTSAAEVDFAMLSDIHAKEIPSSLNSETTGVSMTDSSQVLTIDSDGIHIALPQGSNASWQISTADGITLLSGSSYADHYGISIPFKAEEGRVYIVSFISEGKTVHKKFIKN